jgi:hypothetical protein
MVVPFRKVLPGQKLRGNVTAAAWNKLMDLAQQGPDLTGRSAPPPVRQSGVVLVQNDSGSDQEQYAVLGIDVPIITPTANEAEFKRQVTFSCSTPEAGTHEGRFVVLLDAIPDGAIGRAVVAGVAQVRLTGADVGRAEIDDGETVLIASAAGSAEVLWAEAGSSERWAVVDVRSRGSAAASYALARRSTVLSVADNAQTTVGLDILDYASGVDLGTFSGLNGLRINKLGNFRAAGHISFAANSTGDRGVYIWIYNSAFTLVDTGILHFMRAPNAFSGSLTVSGDFEAPTNPTYVTLVAVQSSGGNLNISAPSSSYLGARLSVQEVV